MCAPPTGDGEIDATVLAACRLAGADAVYRMGGAQADRRARLRHRDHRAGRRDRRPGQPVRPGGQAPGARTRWGSTASPGPSDLLVIAVRRRRRPGRWRSICSPRPSTAPARSSSRVSDSPQLLDALADRVAAGPDSEAIVRLVAVEALDPEAIALGQAFAPEHLQLVGAAAEALRRPADPRRLPVRRCRRRHRVRRLHRGLEPRAADDRRGTVRLRRSRRRTSAAATPRCGSPIRPRWRGPRRRSPAPRGSSTTPGRWRRASGRMGAMARTAEIERTTGETEVDVRLGLDGPRPVASGAPESASSITCSTSWPATARSSSTCRRPVTCRPGRHHTVEDVGICIGQALDSGARRPRRDRPLRPRDGADGRSTGDVRDRHLRPGVHGVRGRAAVRGDRQLRPRADRGVLPRPGRQRPAHAARADRGGNERPPHDRGRVQGAGPGARARRWPSTRARRGSRARRACCEPGADRGRRLRDGQPPLGAEGTRAVGVEAPITHGHDAAGVRSMALVLPGRRRVSEGDGEPARRWGWTSSSASGSPPACRCSGCAWGCSSCSRARASSRRPTGSACCPAPCTS